MRDDAAAEEHHRSVAAAVVPPGLGGGRQRRIEYDELLTAAGDERLAFVSLFDPDHPTFLNPPDMPAAIAAYCRQTGQPEPASPPAYARAILESLAFKYRVVLESLEELTGTKITEIRIVGGGSRNRLLNQFTADATGRTVVAGPMEATALGNIAMQMLATGAVDVAGGGEAVIDRSFPVERYRAGRAAIGGRRTYRRFSTTWSSPVPETLAAEPRFLRNLWDDHEAAQLAARPLDLLRYRSNLLGADLRITNFGGGNTSSKFELPDPLTGAAGARAGGQGQRRRPAVDRTGRVRSALSGQAEALVARYRGEAHEDEMVASIRCARSARTASRRQSTRRCTRFCRSPTSITSTPTGRSRWPPARTETASSTEFNARYGRRIVWVPWQRPGFELAMMLRQAVEANPGCDGIVLGGHGLFTWGDTQRECYISSITTIDQMGEFVQEHARRSGRPAFGGPHVDARRSTATRWSPRSCRSCAVPSRRSAA